MLFLRLGLRLVSARRYATINRVAPEATVGVREAVLWPGRPDMCRLAEDAQGLHLAATNVNNDVVGVVSLFVDGAEAAGVADCVERMQPEDAPAFDQALVGKRPVRRIVT